MSLRVILCPVVGTGTPGDSRAFPPVPPDPFRPKLDGLIGLKAMSAVIPSNADGSPKFAWCVVMARADDWTAVDADAQNERLFGIDLPDAVDTFAELKVFLQSKTVGDIPPARRQALNERLTARGIDTSQVTLATTWWQVLRGIYRHLIGRLPDGDGPQA